MKLGFFIATTITICLFTTSLVAQINVANRRLEGPVNVVNPPPGWINCRFTPTTNDGTVHGTPTMPFEGISYMSIHPLPGEEEEASTPLSMALTPGTKYEFDLYLTIAGLSTPAQNGGRWASENFGQNPGQMEIWGATSSCGKFELLWKSPVIIPHTGWGQHTAVFTPTLAHTQLIFRPQKVTPLGLTPYMGLDLISPIEIYQPDPIPTVSEWGLILFGLLILNISSVLLVRKKRDLLPSE